MTIRNGELFWSFYFFPRADAGEEHQRRHKENMNIENQKEIYKIASLNVRGLNDDDIREEIGIMKENYFGAIRAW